MRIDKYLWCIRFYKTRNIATEACKKGHVKINGNEAKPSREIFVQDQITIRKDQINYEITIIAIPTSRVGAKLVNLYRIDNTPEEAFKHVELMRLSQDYYRKKGEGRPTKKDRRDLDDWFDTNNTDIQDDETDF